jgi:hypothetical protein
MLIAMEAAYGAEGCATDVLAVEWDEFRWIWAIQPILDLSINHAQKAKVQ